MYKLIIVVIFYHVDDVLAIYPLGISVKMSTGGCYENFKRNLNEVRSNSRGIT